jgi:hypothetical protein
MLGRLRRLRPWRYVHPFTPSSPPLVRGFVGVCCRVDGLTCVAKALELFMDRIIKAVADETKARGARRVTPSHLYVPFLYPLHGIIYQSRDSLILHPISR